MITSIRTTLLMLAVFCAGIASNAQILQNNNYNFQYNTESDFRFDMKAIRSADRWTIFYKLQIADTTKSISDYSIQLEKRKSVSDKTGDPLAPEEINLTMITADQQKQIGKLNMPIQTEAQIFVAKITDHHAKQDVMYYQVLEPNYPVNAYLANNNSEPIFDNYINKETAVSIQGFAESDVLTVYFYNDFFPTAAPAFSEGQAKVSKRIKADSVFNTKANQLLTLKSIGLYLVQKDTNSVEGFSFRVEPQGYPKFRRIQDLVGPFIYVCTKEEFQSLRLAGSDKKEFDRQVLKITRSRERAQDFMRVYFQRAEAANRFFSSYKEGWKTDRGMMLIIYGLPDKVFKFADREVWSYGKTNFNFIKSPTLFDPDNYVLLRSNKFTEQWYEKVDLVRNSRF